MTRRGAIVATTTGTAIVVGGFGLAARGATAFTTIGGVVGGSLALYGLLLALAGWFGRDVDGFERPLVGLSAVGLVLVAVPAVGVDVGLLAWAIVTAFAALFGGLPAVVLLFRASRRPPG